MIEVSDYDFFDYDYSQYWKTRKYEDLAERNVLNKIFEKKNGKWFVDIGGSYGRLTPTYYKKYEHSIVLDYSLKTLQKNYSILKQKYPNIELIAANAYHMPFRDDVIDGALMVRVLHHISAPTEYFKEMGRVMHNDSTYVQEFANKVNLKAVLRALLHFNFDIFSIQPYQQPTKSNFEGTKKGEEALFFNFHPQYVENMLKEEHFILKEKYGCSYLRSALLKKLLGDEKLLKIEYLLQKLLHSTNIPPSIIFETERKEVSLTNSKSLKKLSDILVCPACHSNLKFEKNIASCAYCEARYLKKDNIWDFRVN